MFDRFNVTLTEAQIDVICRSLDLGECLVRMVNGDPSDASALRELRENLERVPVDHRDWCQAMREKHDETGWDAWGDS